MEKVKWRFKITLERAVIDEVGALSDAVSKFARIGQVEAFHRDRL